MSERSTAIGVVLWIAILLVGFGLIICHNVWWHEFIRTSFSYNGEDYYKTIGAVLREDYDKGLFLYTAEPFSFWLVVAFIVLSLLPHERVTVRIIMGLTGLYLLYVLLYVGTKSYDLYTGTFDNKERVVAIGSAGISRLIGVAIGCWLAIKVDAFGRINALLQRTKYQRPTHQLR
ncbi:MAG TPA: hypothetical protein PLP28_02485 [Flavobacteriales bacterium]|nr:hypothetical protein [Flavobacteriales bacterium]HMZ47820.1 hypothetical protein [Flavobacteriales bacterium]HNM68249.1 hypothetical protein [Flavobacteriales bacterium]